MDCRRELRAISVKNNSIVTVISEICCKFANEIGKMEIKDIHPLTIITDRYGGIYS